MKLTVILGRKSYGSEHRTRYSNYSGEDDFDIPTYRVRIAHRSKKEIDLSFENKDKDGWHEGGDLSIPRSVARRLGASLVAFSVAAKKKPIVFHVREGSRIRIRA
jgi:hypothetical protein